MNILFTAQFLPAYTASRFASALEDAFELSPSAFRIVYTVPYQPASGFAQFYFDPTTAGYAAAAEIAHRLYAQSAGTLLVFFDIAALSGQPMLPPVNTTTVPANFTTTFAPAPTNYTVAPSNGTNYTTPSTTTGTAPSSHDRCAAHHADHRSVHEHSLHRAVPPRVHGIAVRVGTGRCFRAVAVGVPHRLHGAVPAGVRFRAVLLRPDDGGVRGGSGDRPPPLRAVRRHALGLLRHRSSERSADAATGEHHDGPCELHDDVRACTDELHGSAEQRHELHDAVDNHRHGAQQQHDRCAAHHADHRSVHEHSLHRAVPPRVHGIAVRVGTGRCFRAVAVGVPHRLHGAVPAGVRFRAVLLRPDDGGVRGGSGDRPPPLRAVRRHALGLLRHRSSERSADAATGEHHDGPCELHDDVRACTDELHGSAEQRHELHDAVDNHRHGAQQPRPLRRPSCRPSIRP
jgi:hypothetical protein